MKPIAAMLTIRLDDIGHGGEVPVVLSQVLPEAIGIGVGP
jgi:hypothetical protein